ncbi:MAG TPA: T9SS type A sorting domain-containing protein [Flavipsychrobacter sp.]|nr:T9SS type A sorting domain-containing protein [Flavipsychrobacter sp.]
MCWQKGTIFIPNPATAFLFNDNATKQTLLQITFHSIDGKLLRTQTHPGTNRLSTEGLADGIYYLHIRFTNHTTLVRKIIIQKH